MKKMMAALLISLAAMSAVAKDQTLLDETDAWKMYTRAEAALTDIDGNMTTLGSLSVGWMLNEKLSLGPSLTMSMESINSDVKGDIESFDLWYAGLRAEYTLRSSDLLHLSASALFGGASVSVAQPGLDDDTSSCVVFEPGLNCAVNLADWIEFGVGISYRLTDGIDVGGYNEDAFRDWNVSAFLLFTEF